LGLDAFAWDLVDEEAAKDNLTAEEYIAFSVLYYLADIDSGRIARCVPKTIIERRAKD
jgi:hypothetical protein